MPIRITRALLFLAILAILPLSSCASSTPDENQEASIHFVTTPFVDDPSVQTPLPELDRQLEEATGFPVEITDVPNYSAAVEAVRAGHEDISLISGFATALAISTQQVEPLVAWPGDEVSASHCIVREDSPLESLEDITSDTLIAFADPASESGYFLALHMLNTVGLREDEDFQSLFAGSHDRALLALKNHDADIACVTALFTAMAGQNSPLFPFDEGETRLLGESIPKPIATAIVANADISAEKRAALMEALPTVLNHDNIEQLGVYVQTLPENADPILNPGREHFLPYLQIAALADVDLTEMG